MDFSRWIGGITLVTVILAPVVYGADGPAEVNPDMAWDVPRYIDPMDGLRGTVHVPKTSAGAELEVEYRYSTGEAGRVKGSREEGGGGVFGFAIPGVKASGLGTLELTARLDGGKRMGTVSVPTAYVEELDITGNPPDVLPYELGDGSHRVEYIPCCNIFGGVMDVARVPVNPMETDEGLPGVLYSDFVVLEPDDLTASTAGTHLHFAYDTAEAGGNVAVYTYNWREGSWREVHSYEVDSDAGTVDFHCPDGGIFVLGHKAN